MHLCLKPLLLLSPHTTVTVVVLDVVLYTPPHILLESTGLWWTLVDSRNVTFLPCICHILSHHITYLATWTPVDSISLYATILVNKGASNNNMLVIDENCMSEGATELILTG